MSAYLIHVSLDTGHVHRSRREEAGDDAVERVANILEAALAQPGEWRGFDAPGSGVSLRATAQGAALLTTVAATADGPMPLVTFGVARNGRSAAALWPRLLAARGPTSAPRIERPQAPWLAVVTHPALVLRVDAVTWLGDLERLVAWAWVERRIAEPDR